MLTFQNQISSDDEGENEEGVEEKDKEEEGEEDDEEGQMKKVKSLVSEQSQFSSFDLDYCVLYFSSLSHILVISDNVVDSVLGS